MFNGVLDTIINPKGMGSCTVKTYKIVKIETKFKSHALFEIEFDPTMDLQLLKRQIRIIKSILQDERINVDYLVTSEVIDLIIGHSKEVYVSDKHYLTFTNDKIIVWEVTEREGISYTTMRKI